MRDLGDRGFLTLALRKQLDASGDLGPEIVASGPPITVRGGHCPSRRRPHRPGHRRRDSAEEAARRAPYGLVALTGLGMTNLEVLRAATSVAAAACGLTGRKGRLAPGADADLAAVSGEPLDDISAVHDVVAVFRAGRRVR